MLDINAVIYGLIYLFYEPNPDDPLNRGTSAFHILPPVCQVWLLIEHVLRHDGVYDEQKRPNCTATTKRSLPTL